MPARRRIDREFKDVEKYEYLLVEYLKEMSNEMTYLMLVVVSLFLFVVIDIVPSASLENPFAIKVVLVVLMAGGLILFGMTSLIKRNIERRFERIFS
jgi:uncharacterized membrane protein